MSSYVNLYDATSINTIDWSAITMAAGEIEYLTTLVKEQPQKYIENANATLMLLRVDSQLMPITISNDMVSNTYLVSLHTQYVDYCIEELSVITNRYLQKVARITLVSLGKLLKWGQLDKCIHVNNWLFPTNLYPQLSDKQIAAITNYLQSAFPDYAILFRTLNFITDQSVLKHLTNQQYQLIGSRQVHILTKETLQSFAGKKPRDLRKDEKVLSESSYKIAKVEPAAHDISRLQALYSNLYIEKHSVLNPHYTAEFIGLLAKNKMFNLLQLELAGSADAFIGYHTRQSITYAPLFGYDTKLPAESGLYRMLSAIKINAAIDNNTILNSSAGAAGFKRHRGHTSTIEYHAVYLRHLSAKRRLVWKMLICLVNKVGIPAIQKYDT